MTSGLVPLVALLLVAGCGTEPTDGLRNGTTRIEASPSQLFLQLDESKSVDVEAVDSQGNQISSAYVVSNTGAGITVRRDSTFLPIFINDSTLSVPPEAPVFRYVVTATNYGATSFTVSANGRDVVIPVQVVAQNVVQAQISNLNPALNEVVTITAPPGITFTDTTTVTFAGAAVQPAEVTVAADGRSVTFLPPPNIVNAQAVLGNVVSDAAPTVPFSPSTADRITTPALTVFDGTISNLTPAANEPITVTLTNATFVQDTTATFAIGAAPALLIARTANTVTLIPAPSSSGLLFLNSGVVIDSLPQFALTLSNAETDTLTVGAAGTVPGTDDPSTAPSLAVPDPGFAAPFFDNADFVASANHFYKLVVPADGDYTISLDWTVGSDIDMLICPAPGAITGACDFTAATGAQPESAVFSLTAGTYFVVADDYAGDAGPSSTLTITVAR
ncbi:MAG: hypothetical protein ABIQ49_13845 [Gemmatimonadales bacterium]